MKTVAISLQLFYYISEMENNYIKRNYMEQKRLRDEIIAAARRERYQTGAKWMILRLWI